MRASHAEGAGRRQRLTDTRATAIERCPAREKLAPDTSVAAVSHLVELDNHRERYS